MSCQGGSGTQGSRIEGNRPITVCGGLATQSYRIKTLAAMGARRLREPLPRPLRPTAMSLRRAALILPLVLLAAACGEDAPDRVVPRDDGASYAADAVVLRISHRGGFVPSDFAFGALPTVAVYGDGRVLTAGPEPAIYPGRALPSVQVARISPADVDRLVADARSAGVDGRDWDGMAQRVTDVGSTVFGLTTADGKTVETEVYALDMSQDSGNASQLSEEERAAHKQLAAFRAALTDLERHLGAGHVSATTEHEPTSVAVLALPYGEVSTEEPAPGTAVWKGPDPRTGSRYLDGHCVVVSGPAWDLVRPDVRQAARNTRWTAATATYRMTFRPLLPEERDCADLGASDAGSSAAPTPQPSRT